MSHQGTTNFIESKEEALQEEIKILEDKAEKGIISYEEAQPKILDIYNEIIRLNNNQYA